MACMCAVHCILFLFVGRCCWGQGNYQFARSLCLLLCLSLFDLVCWFLVKDWIAGCLIFKWSWSALVVFDYWDLHLFVEPLCSMVHLVRFSLGSFLGRLQIAVPYALWVVVSWNRVVIRVVVPTLVCLIVGHSVLSWYALWFLTFLCGCWLRSTSLPGGHKVDGLPPAPS